MVAAFTHSTGATGLRRNSSSKLFLSSYPQDSNLNSFLTSVTVFDGSDLTDTVVRSNTFWSTLSSKLPYFIAAELLATVTFVAIASVVASQGQFLIDKVSSDAQKSKQFKRLDDVSQPVQLDFTKLLLCIVIDILGSANEAIPLVGELVDVVYAPIAALLLRQLFNGSNVVFLLEFGEEILPFTDILPLATICWVVEAFFGNGNLAKALRIGAYAPNIETDTDKNYIDVKAEVKSSALLQSNKQDDKDAWQ
eukprot:scaffold6461_cov101-Skeletonema_dohrnii-CCMP3373.AAC.2